MSRFGTVPPMRDFMAATRDRIIVYDGGMGATLEQFDLSLENDYKLPGRCHEVLVLNRPDVIEGVHTAMLDAGAEVLETDTFQASRLKLSEWGLEDHTFEINQKAAEIARKAAGENRFVAGSIGPTGFLPASDDPTLGQIQFPELADRVRGAGARADQGWRGPDHHRDRAGHPRGQGRRVRRPRGVQADRPHGPDPVQRVAPAPGREDAARDRHQRRAGHARGARRRRDRAELLDRPRGHARRDPLPRRELPGPRPLHPERRPPAPGPERRDDLPRGARAARERARRVHRALRRHDRRRLLRHDAGAHRRDRGARPGDQAGRAPGAPAAAHRRA